METVGIIAGYLLAGSFILIILMLLLEAILHGIGAIFSILHKVALFIIAIPVFIFNPKQFMEGYRLGKEYPGADIETIKLLEKTYNSPE